MKILAAVVVALALCVQSATAGGTFYVRADGLDANSGLVNDASGAWRTIAKAMATMVAGDATYVVSLADTTQSISTIRSGAQFGPPLGSVQTDGRIKLIGNILAPINLPVASITLKHSWIVVRGFRARSLKYEYPYTQIPPNPADHDSVANCIVGDARFWGAKDCVLANSTIRGNLGFYCEGGRALGDISNCERDTLIGNQIVTKDINPSNGDHHIIVVRCFSQGILVERNRITGNFVTATVPTDNQESWGLICYNAGSAAMPNVFRDNHWTLESTNSNLNANPEAIRIRDDTRFTRFERDTILAGLNSPGFPIKGIQLSSGSFDTTGLHNITWDRVRYISNGTQDWQHRITNSSIRFSTMVTSANLLMLFRARATACSLYHNTFAAKTQIFQRESEEFYANTVIWQNAFYVDSVLGSNCGSGSGARAVLKYTSPTGGFSTDYNNYFARRGPRPGDPTCAVSPFDSSRYAIGRPGPIFHCIGPTSVQCPAPGSAWCVTHLKDCGSKWGNPQFANPAFTASFDGQPRNGSAAVGPTYPCIDVTAPNDSCFAGAIAPADSVPPDSLVTFDAVLEDVECCTVPIGGVPGTDCPITFTWTNTGDNGNVAQASTIAFAMCPVGTTLDRGNFASFIRATGTPEAPGTSQSFEAQMNTGAGFTGEARVQMRICDDQGNCGYSEAMVVSCL